MENIKEFIINHKYILGGELIVLVCGSIFLINYFMNDNYNDNVIALESNDITTSEKSTTTSILVDNSFYVDIKGSINKPGVYKANDTMIVNDIIGLAGGLKSNAYTKNINLAESVTKGMIIYVYSKYEIYSDDIKSSTTCSTNVITYGSSTTTKKETTTTEVQSIININTATIEELQTLTGIGESKAKAIIEYREKTPFVKIEDIKNVTGIGDSLFEKIKDNISV